MMNGMNGEDFIYHFQPQTFSAPRCQICSKGFFSDNDLVSEILLNNKNFTYIFILTLFRNLI